MKTKLRGFTLIELMIVVLILGILAAIAWPQYTGFVRKTRAADAQGDLLELVSYVERFYTTNNTYVGLNNAALPFPDNRRGGGGTEFYRYRINNVTATAFTLRAVPKNDQTSFTECGTMRIRATGRRTPTSGCWK